MMNEQTEFDRITGRRYSSMRSRFSEKRDRYGRISELGFEVPFTLAQFREYLTSLLGGQEGYVHCEYCNRPLNIHTLELDHRLPPSRGGEMGFNNLAPCCHACNQQKGKMSAIAFMRLRALVMDPKKFDEIDCDNVLGRLQSQVKLAWHRQKQLRAKQQVRVQRHMKNATSARKLA